MSDRNLFTTVKIMRSTRDKLVELGKKQDTYDDIIKRLIEFYHDNNKVNEEK